MLTEDEVRHVAKLARIDLTDNDVKKFSKQLSDVLDYMDILSDVDTDDVEMTNQVTGIKNAMRKDEVTNPKSTRDELLDCSELPKDSKQIRVLPAIK